jgi:hypothetical protein
MKFLSILFWIVLIGVIVIVGFYLITIVLSVLLIIALIVLVIQVLGGAGLVFLSSVCSRKDDDND